MTEEEDIANLAGQLARLTQTVDALTRQISSLHERAERQEEATGVQQERVELAARELAEVSSRLQAAADALREVIRDE